MFRWKVIYVDFAIGKRKKLKSVKDLLKIGKKIRIIHKKLVKT